MSPPAVAAPAALAGDAAGFERFVSAELAAGLRKMGIVAPNAIQADAVPLALSGRDLMVVAQTGSGKTLVFLLPMLQRLAEVPVPEREPGPAQPEALVLAPSEELAAQVAQVARELSDLLPCRPTVERLNAADAGRNARVAVATPEEALRGLREGGLALERLRLLAVDEADAVLCGRGGLAEEVDALLRQLESRPEPPQLFLTMAHLTEVRENELVSRFPTVQRVGHTGVLVPTLRQCFHYFREGREEKLLDVLRSAAEDRWLREGTAMVFCSRAETAEQLRALLEERLPGCRPRALHEGMEAEERAAVTGAFRSGASRVLLTTDSAVRGLDFPELRHVVMYDVPSDITAFVHCAGRTARRGQRGLVTCLVQTHEASLYQFDFRSHHGLQPAVQLHFQHAEVAKGPAAEKAEAAGNPAKDDTVDEVKPAPAGPKREKPKQPRQRGKERRCDPMDGKAYTLEELRRYYEWQYTEAAIFAYWQDECTPLLSRR